MPSPLLASFRATRLAVLIFLLLVTGTRSGLAVVHEVTVQNFQFIPSQLSITEGDVVRWIWLQGIHTTTNGSSPTAPGAGTLWNAPIDISNQIFERTFNTVGSFPYHCAFHFSNGMTGTITVLEANAAPVLANPGTLNGEEEVFFTITLTATDPDLDPLTLSDNGTTPSWASFVDNGDGTATLSGTPALGDSGTYPVTVTASDGTLSDSESFDIVIAAALIDFVDLTSSGFVPAEITIDVGYKIRWTKVAGGNHTTTSGTGPGDPQAGAIWDAELRAASPEFTFEFPTQGTFPYFCANHPDETGTVIVQDSHVGIPDLENLPGLRFSARPNPFLSSVLFSLELEEAGRVAIDLYDVSGRRVRALHTGELPAGRREIPWDGADDAGRILPGGMYFVRVAADDRVGTSKLLKLR